MSSWHRRETEIILDIIRACFPAIFVFISTIAVYYFYLTGRLAFMFPVLGAVLGSLVALLILWRSPDLSIDTYKSSTTSFIFQDYRLSTSIVLLLSSLILIVHFNHLYSRPAVSYPLFGIACAYLAFNIHIGVDKRLNILHIFVVAASIYSTSHLVFPAGPRVNNAGPRTAAEILQLGYVPSSGLYPAHPGFLIQTGAFAELANISAFASYSLLALIIVAGTVLVIGNIDRTIPSINAKVAQYSALILATASYTLNRGANPHFTSFFYVHTALILLVLFAIFTRRSPRRFGMIGFLIILAATLGHEYSAGAPFAIVVFALPVFFMYLFLKKSSNRNHNLELAGVFISSYGLIYFAHQLYYKTGGGMSRRIAEMLLSFKQMLFRSPADSTATGTTGGIYSQLPTEVLLQATMSEMMLFAILFGGICLLFALNRFDLDVIVLLIGGAFIILVVGVVVYPGGIPAQRIYHTMLIFGGCVAAGAGLYSFTSVTPSRFRGIFICSFICVFAVLSLFSPVAGIALSPIDVVHSPGEYNTAYSETNTQWTTEYANGERLSDTQFRLVNDSIAEVDTKNIDSGTLYVYDKLYADSGVRLYSTQDLGADNIARTQKHPQMEYDNIVYTNGETISYISSDH